MITTLQNGSLNHMIVMATPGHRDEEKAVEAFLTAVDAMATPEKKVEACQRACAAAYISRWSPIYGDAPDDALLLRQAAAQLFIYADQLATPAARIAAYTFPQASYHAPRDISDRIRIDAEQLKTAEDRIDAFRCAIGMDGRCVIYIPKKQIYSPDARKLSKFAGVLGILRNVESLSNLECLRHVGAIIDNGYLSNISKHSDEYSEALERILTIFTRILDRHPAMIGKGAVERLQKIKERVLTGETDAGLRQRVSSLIARAERGGVKHGATTIAAGALAVGWLHLSEILSKPGLATAPMQTTP